MKIIAENLTKKYNQNLVFHDFNYRFSSPGTYVILGTNGSGKSTLLKVLCGMMPPTEGQVSFMTEEGSNIEDDQLFQYISFSAPYMDLPRELDVIEVLDIHQKLRGSSDGSDLRYLLESSKLENYIHTKVKRLSSGMYQRLKLILMFVNPRHIMIFDEPSSNLDEQGLQWFLKTLNFFLERKMVLIASNNKNEVKFDCEFIDINEYK